MLGDKVGSLTPMLGDKKVRNSFKLYRLDIFRFSFFSRNVSSVYIQSIIGGNLFELFVCYCFSGYVLFTGAGSIMM